MNVHHIGRHADVYTFDSIDSYLTHVFLIHCKTKVFLIDTFCGSDSMAPIVNRLRTEFYEKEAVVINTHFHWDHVWGNCSFPDADIISHVRCRQLLGEHWDEQLRQNGQYISGRAERMLPNITFDTKLMFPEEGIELFHSPGHTADSISVFDHMEGILYTGDNLEKPIIYVEDPDIDTYIHTLRNYLAYQPKKIVAGHTLNLTQADILQTIEYLNGLQCGREMQFATAYETQIHRQNLRCLRRNDAADRF